MDGPKIQFSTVSDPLKWDSEGAGVICFASPEDAKRAEVIFNSVQGTAFKAGREAGMREAAAVCQSHEPKDFTTAGIITRAKCANAILSAIEGGK